jgi:16S rRNA (adenine1518-N6/adenine1519-N6)-dimethyltransferase
MLRAPIRVFLRSAPSNQALQIPSSVIVQTLTEIRQLLAERGLTPRHRLGQNFLHDKNQLNKLVDAAAIRLGEVVVEVGPGTGTLTETLLERGAVVIACELDANLADLIADRLLPNPSLTLIRGDAMGKQRSLHPDVVSAISGREFKLVANLPYQIASQLMSTLLIDHENCMGQYVTVQREVADRLMASPASKAYGALTIIVQSMATVARIATLSPSCFWPPPEVNSAMIVIHPTGHSFAGENESRRFARFITELFSKRRKQLGTIFGRGSPAWIDPEVAGRILPEARPESLSIEQALQLWRAFGSASVKE